MKRKITLRAFNKKIYPTEASRTLAMLKARTGLSIESEIETQSLKIIGDKAIMTNTGKSINVIQDSPFDHRKISLESMFNITFDILSATSGMSALIMKHRYGISYPKTLSLLYKLRQQMGECLPNKFSNSTIAIGIYYIKNGRSFPRLRGFTTQNYYSILQIVESSGKCRLILIPHDENPGQFMISQIKKFVDENCVIYTSDLHLKKLIENKSATVKQTFNSSLNNMRSIEKKIKRFIGDVHHGASVPMLQNYLNEVAFKYSYRNEPDYGFNIFLKGMKPLFPDNSIAA